MEKFDNEERLRLLQFVTGTSSVPIAGFKALRGSNGPKKFTIDFYNDVQAFPRWVWYVCLYGLLEREREREREDMIAIEIRHSDVNLQIMTCL